MSKIKIDLWGFDETTINFNLNILASGLDQMKLID